MIASSPDRLHAAACGGTGDDSHTSGQSSTASIHHFHQLHNFELNESCTKGDHDLLLLDGRLPPTTTTGTSTSTSTESGERSFTKPTPSAKQRAPPPPALTLKIPEHPRSGIEWQTESRSPGASPATHTPTDYSDVSEGYFSPPRSPDPSPSTPLPPSSVPLVAKARSRARSLVNGDLPRFSAGAPKHRVLHKMVKERRSLQSFLMPSFLQLQPQSGPLGLVGTDSRAASTQDVSPTSSSNGNSDSSSSASVPNARVETRRSFYGRRRSHTYSGRDGTLTSPSLVSSVTRMPPMPEQYPPQSSGPAPGGRESPSSYLLDDDPFAVSPVMVAPPVNSPLQSPGFTPIHSPAHSIAHSPSTVSLSSASSTSMPGTPIFQSFGALPEEAEEPAQPTSVPNAPVSTTPAQPTPSTSPPPPTPSSPLNPHANSITGASESAELKEKMLRALSASLSAHPLPSFPSPQSASSSRASPSNAVPSLPQPPPTRVRPAHTRPAFAPRPSLPSLSTLSRMGAAAGGFASSLRGKKRRGRVGAGLPAEPWDLPTTESKSEEQQAEEIPTQESVVLSDTEEDFFQYENTVKETEDGKKATEDPSGTTESGASCAPEPHTSVDPAHEIVCESDKVLASQSKTEEVSPPSTVSKVAGDEDLRATMVPTSTRIFNGDVDTTETVVADSEKREANESVSLLEGAAENEGVNWEDECVSGNAHGEGGNSIDAEPTYITTTGTSIEHANGESASTPSMLATLSVNAPFSGTHQERRDICAERGSHRDADLLIEEDNLLNLGPSGDEADLRDELLHHLAGPEAESGASLANVGSCRIAIPGRASAIPRHVLRALTPYPFSAPRCSSPASSNASWSPQSSVEDFGVLLSASPAFRGDQRPESLTIDPGLPEPSVFINAYKQDLSSGENHFDLDRGASSSSSSSAPLPSTIPRERGDSGIEVVAETGADIDFGSGGDTDFATEAEVPADSSAPAYATLLSPSLPSRGSLVHSSPIATRSDFDTSDRSVSRSPIRGDCSRFDYESPSSYGDRSFSPQHVENYAQYYRNDIDHGFDHEQNELQPSEEEDDSSMLPPLSTLPEEDPVFTLTTSHPRERYEPFECVPPPPSRSISRKASAGTIASIFSMRSGSSGCASQISHAYSRTHSPAASLSTTLPISNSQTGSSTSKRVHGSSSGSTDSGRGHAPSSSVSSLRSKSSVDLRGLANARRHGSQSSGFTMLSRSSTRTKYEPQVEAHGQKKSSVEDLSLGLRVYSGNPYAAAVQAELEGKASKYGQTGNAKYDDDELVLDIRREDERPGISEAILSAWNVKPAAVDAFEPGSSAGTLRPSIDQQGSVHVGSRSPTTGKLDGFTSTREHTNGYNYSNNRGGSGKDWEGFGGFGGGHGNGYYGRSNGGSGSDESGNHGGPPGAGRSGRGNDRDEDENYSRRPSAYNATSSEESESESESESSEDDYGEQSPGISQTFSKAQAPAAPGHSGPMQTQEEPEVPIFSQLRNGRKGVFRPPTASVADSGNGARTPAAEDDDVPLAKRIPGALQAQKSIRQQVKSERERRRRERSTAPTPRTSRAPEGTISPPPQHVPVTSQDERGRTLTTRLPRSAPLNSGPAPLSSSQEAAMMAQRLLQPHHATHAVHRQRAKTLSGADGVPPDALTQRLLKVQARGQDQQMSMQRTSAASSIHAQTPARLNTESAIDRTSAAHSMTRRGPISPLSGPHHVQQQPVDGPVPARTLRPMRSFHGVAHEQAPATPSVVPSVPAPTTRRRSPSRARPTVDADATPSGGLTRNRSVKSARPSSEKTSRKSDEEAFMHSAHHHPHSLGHTIPPLPGVSRGPSPPAPTSRHNVTQTRIYISDMQHFNVVEAGLDTSAKDVLDMLRHQGDLRGEERRSSSWMLYEVCHDYGMERPVRSFELVTDISGSWNKDKTMNCFMVKPSPFAQSLATIPSSIPTRSGFVDYESKKGKWSKRWLELREHGLWLSKREGKDDEFLCSLSAFDAYVVTRLQKAPKGFTFAVKSTDPITLFENKSDYLHVFSVPEDTGVAWLEAIWRARSYILYQEKNVLFRNKSTGEGTNTGANLARSGTRKKPAQAYVNLESTGPFEPGSLLAKRAAVV